MCGIAGEIRFDGGLADRALVTRMTEKMQPRGPDGSGLYAQGPVAMGHRRLGIIDLSNAAQQPMVDPELGLSIVFNGCIYNYPELRQELEGLGYRFFSHGDTEVMLKAYHAWGPDFVHRLYGMFAFCIVERDSGTAVLGRDRLGIKPLYLAWGNDRLRFASALPSLLEIPDLDRSIDRAALHHYLTFHAVVPPPRTILNGVRKLPPATLLTIQRDGSREEKRYWTLPFGPREEERGLPVEQWRERVLSTLRRAVHRRMVADVPVGVLLSGGLDSSLVVGLLAEAGQRGLKTFSIGFETVGNECGDEFQYSDLIADRFGTDHQRIFIDSDRTLQELAPAIRAMSEPMVSHDAIGFYLLAEEVSKHVKVVQSGQGADEIFAGYHWYPPLLNANGDGVDDYARTFADRDHAEMASLLTPDYLNGDFSRDFIREHFAKPGAERVIDRALRMDIEIMLVDDPVKRVDNMTMAWSLEARVPFLDHELVELAARVPPELKVQDGGKWILKEAARSVIPEAVIDRPKGYFPVPALKYLQGPYLDLVRDALSSSAARQRGLFRQDYLSRLFDDPAGQLTPLGGSKLWQVAVLELWLQGHGIS